MPQTFSIAFIGTGVMGSSMAGHLLDRGHALRVYNRTPARARGLAARGAHLCASVEEAVCGAEAVLSMVGTPEDVREIYLGPGGVLAHLRPGTLALDLTTSSPLLARELHERGRQAGIEVADAPVTGGDVGAREGTLTVLFGGSETAFERSGDILGCFARRCLHLGPAGSGQLAKAANQIAVAGTMLSVCECLAFARSCGLDAQQVLEAVDGGAGGSFSMHSYGPRILSGDFAPGFLLRHFVKDLKIALQAAADCGLELEGTQLALRLCSQLEREGLSEQGTQALHRHYMAGGGRAGTAGPLSGPPSRRK